MIKLKRAYEPAASSDGQRILVERLWPRGLSKDKARIDGWVKNVAPTPDLRRWYSHDPSKWEEFRARYREELEAHPEAVAEVVLAARSGTVTFIFGSRETVRNSATVLKAFVEQRL